MVLIRVLPPSGLHPSHYVSVPLRGLWFLSSTLTTTLSSMMTLFPSPYGDYGSYQNFALNSMTSFLGCFRPLTGIMVLIRKLDYHEITTDIGKCFRPLTGIMVLILGLHIHIHILMCMCFRPLTGIMVLIRNDCKLYARLTRQVSVPLRGLWFLSIVCK